MQLLLLLLLLLLLFSCWFFSALSVFVAAQAKVGNWGSASLAPIPTLTRHQNLAGSSQAKAWQLSHPMQPAPCNTLQHPATPEQCASFTGARTTPTQPISNPKLRPGGDNPPTPPFRPFHPPPFAHTTQLSLACCLDIEIIAFAHGFCCSFAIVFSIPPKIPPFSLPPLN